MSARHPDAESALTRFREAQDRPDSGFESALREIRAGAKQGHWIWWVFPQLSGLGTSSVSRAYGVHGLAEAEQYLRDATLRSRLLTITSAVADHLAKGASIETLMGSSIDAMKLVSSLTLFGRAARELHATEGRADYGALARVAATVLNAVERQGYGPCQYTLSQVAGDERAGISMLAQKLHLKPGMRIAVVNPPDGFARTLGTVPAGVTRASSLERDLDLVMVFASTQKGLSAEWPKAVAALKPEGALWVSYPKKSSGTPTDLGMGEWEASKGSDWNPVAMIAVDDTWSSTRFRLAPGLDRAREARQDESVRDTDGTVCVDRKNRVVTPPADLRKLLAANTKARALFDTLAFTHKREYVEWIIGAKRPETRAARLTRTVQMLSKGKKNPSDK